MSDTPLVIGVGNALRCDDGVGPAVAERLAAAGWRTLTLSGEGAGLIEAWSDEPWVIVVDAARSGAPAGTVRRFEAVTEILAGGLFHYSSHQFGLAEAVETARALGRLPERLTIFAVEGAEFAQGTTISPPVVEAAERVLHEIVAAMIPAD